MRSVDRSQDGRLEVRFNSPSKVEFFDLVEKIKDMPDRKFDPKAKNWSVPDILVVRQKLAELGFDLSRIVQTGEPTVKEFDPRLFPFQAQGLNRAVDFGGRCLLAWEMGLGKTCASLAYLETIPEERPVIVVCPASVKLNWMREIRKWVPKEQATVIFGTRRTYCKGFSMIVINYDILEAHLEYLITLEPKVLIADEVQYVKNPASLRSQALRELSKKVRVMFGLSGTPIMNRPSEFWPILSMLKPAVWKSRTSFLYRYCGAYNDGWGLRYDRATNIPELNKILTDEVMHRVLKKDVLKELPDKRYTVVPFEADNMGQYKSLEEQMVVMAKKTIVYSSALNLLSQLRNLAVDGKFPKVVDWIRDFLDSDEKLVVYAIHHKVIDGLMATFGKIAVKLDGRDDLKKRESAIAHFQHSPEVRLFVANIEAGGIGIDGLQNAASNVAFAELPWVPASVDQAADRLHRMGQKDAVQVYYLIAEKTIEERMAEVIDEKRKVLDAVLDGRETPEMNMILELLKKYGKEGV